MAAASDTPGTRFSQADCPDCPPVTVDLCLLVAAEKGPEDSGSLVQVYVTLLVYTGVRDVVSLHRCT